MSESEIPIKMQQICGQIVELSKNLVGSEMPLIKEPQSEGDICAAVRAFRRAEQANLDNKFAMFEAGVREALQEFEASVVTTQPRPPRPEDLTPGVLGFMCGNCGVDVTPRYCSKKSDGWHWHEKCWRECLTL